MEKIKKIFKNKKILIIGIIILLALTCFILFLCFKKDNNTKDNGTYLTYSYDTINGDHYYNKALLVDGITDIVHVTVKYSITDKTELNNLLDYEYKLLSSQDEKYKDVVINDDNTISYTSLKDKSYNKTKEEIERSFTNSKIHSNFKWED